MIRPMGRPRTRWKEQVYKDKLVMGLEEEDPRDKDREREMAAGCHEAKYFLRHKCPWQ